MAIRKNRPDHPGALDTAELYPGLKAVLHIDGSQFPLEITSAIFCQVLPGTNITEHAVNVRGGVLPGDHIRLLGSLGTEAYANGASKRN